MYIYKYLYEYIYIYISGAPKKLNQTFSYKLLSDFCLTYPILCYCDIEEKDSLFLCVSK